MSISANKGANPLSVKYTGQGVTKVRFNGVQVWPDLSKGDPIELLVETHWAKQPKPMDPEYVSRDRYKIYQIHIDLYNASFYGDDILPSGIYKNTYIHNVPIGSYVQIQVSDGYYDHSAPDPSGDIDIVYNWRLNGVDLGVESAGTNGSCLRRYKNSNEWILEWDERNSFGDLVTKSKSLGNITISKLDGANIITK